MFKRFVSRFVIASMLFSAQVQQANAFIFLLPPLVEFVAGGVIVNQVKNAAIGTIISGLIIYGSADSTQTSSTAFPVHVKINPKDPLVVPPGYSPPTAAQQAAGDYQPNPPSTANQFTGYVIYNPPNNIDCLSSSMSALLICAQNKWTAFFTGATSTTCTSNTTVVLCTSIGVNAGLPFSYTNGSTFQPTTICPVGYTVSGATCINPIKTQVQKPDLGAAGSCEIIRNGNSFAPDPLNPACITGSPAMLKASNGGKFIVNAGTVNVSNPDGRSAAIVTNPDGTTSVTLVQSNAVNGTTETLKIDVTAPNVTTGQTAIAGISTTTVQGIGTGANATPLAPVIVNFPTDLAKAGEAAAAAAPLGAKLDLIHGDLNPSIVPVDAAPADSSALTKAITDQDLTKADIVGMPNNLIIPTPTLFQPFIPVACHPLIYTFTSLTGGTPHTVTMDICPYVPVIQRIAEYSLYLFTAATMFGMLTRRPEGA